MVNPEDVNSLADAIIQLLQNGNLRQVLAEKGYERSKLFSWEKTAGGILEVFEQIGRN